VADFGWRVNHIKVWCHCAYEFFLGDMLQPGRPPPPGRTPAGKSCKLLQIACASTDCSVCYTSPIPFIIRVQYSVQFKSKDSNTHTKQGVPTMYYFIKLAAVNEKTYNLYSRMYWTVTNQHNRKLKHGAQVWLQRHSLLFWKCTSSTEYFALS
jgi:hypothetical protein